MLGTFGLGIIAGILVLGSAASRVGAQAPPELQAMLKWQQAQTIRYDVVAEYKGETAVVEMPGNSPVGPSRVLVADRYEISFDWNPNEMAMAGNAVLKNFPATLPAEMPSGKCGSLKLAGPYDHVEVLSAQTGPAGSNSVQLSIKRTFPAAALSYANEKGVCTPLTVPAATSTDVAGVVVPLGLFFAIPSAVPSNITVGKDGRTMTLKDREWTYTYTLRIVK